MLTKDIRQTIDNARAVLVGKIPNPQSQIDQITTAMIYKFMDDMDLESVDLGGKRQFFAEELEKYSWSNLMSPQLGNEVRMKLYTEALKQLPLSNRIPKLFRNIFKGAYLPFNDSKTLTLFLKEINDISYSNSENLGNGFEYLLSILGSQGDAGMFRTPRNIIDFIVSVVQPKKTDTILDPACGTAGFLISAYKYILQDAKDHNKVLTPTELTTLTENIEGYDISPDMVKLALVNMYLHQFKAPKIYEYDTLTSTTRWDNYFDCILANPPFMTPKGGIQPHNKFGVKANRSEVLFVDYIMEHINSTGKAGIIVPEGIVFKVENAYKKLRKKLIEENNLYAVVGLPNGIFNPYAGVKTSILFLDKQLAKKTDKILFIEVKQDGYDLGAQRRETPDKNDLPEALELLHKWQDSIGAQTEFTTESKLVTIVDKSKLAEGGEYNLTASRYKETQDYSNCKWDMAKLGDVINLNFGTRITKKNNEGTKFPVYGGGGISFFTDTYNREDEFIISRFAMSRQCVRYAKNKFYMLDSGFTFNIKNNFENILSKKYVGTLLLSMQDKIYNCARGEAQKNIDVEDFKNLEIPLPPLEVQEEIVKELDGYQAVIDGAQKVIDNWKSTLPINPNWEKVKLGDTNYLEIIDGDRGSNYPSKDEFSESGYCIFLNTKNVLENGFYLENCQFITKEKDELLRKGKLKRNDVVLTTRGTIGNVGIYSDSIEYEHIRINSGMVILRPTTCLYPEFLFHSLRSPYIKEQINNIRSGAAQPQLPIRTMVDMNIFVPNNIEEQKEVVAKIEEEEKAVEECKKLIRLHQDKIDAKIKSIWGENSEK